MTFDFKANWIQVKNGDQAAFKELFYKTSSSLIHFSKQLVNDSHLAEEVVYEVFVNIWRNRSQIEITGYVKAYLYQSVHNQSINKLRQLRINKNSISVLVDDEVWSALEEKYQVSDFVIEKIEAEDTEARIMEFLDEVSDQCKQIFILSRFKNLENKEIAKMLNISVSTVKTQIYRTLEKLREKLMDKK